MQGTSLSLGGAPLHLGRTSHCCPSFVPGLSLIPARIDVEFGGDEFSIGFNASYVQQVLGVIQERDEFEPSDDLVNGQYAVTRRQADGYPSNRIAP
jgi:hypothetical protein